jgi:hypothetical protein
VLIMTGQFLQFLFALMSGCEVKGLVGIGQEHTKWDRQGTHTHTHTHEGHVDLYLVNSLLCCYYDYILAISLACIILLSGLEKQVGLGSL